MEADIMTNGVVDHSSLCPLDNERWTSDIIIREIQHVSFCVGFFPAMEDAIEDGTEDII